MGEMDVRTRNILNAIENLLTDSKRSLDNKTHEEIVTTLLHSTIDVKEAYDKFQSGEMTATRYGQVLIKLVEITLMAVRRLPS